MVAQALLISLHSHTIFFINKLLILESFYISKVVNIVQSFHSPQTQPALLLMSYISLEHLLVLMNQYQYVIINYGPYVMQRSLAFTLCPLCAPESHPGYHTSSTGPVSLDFS